MFSTIFLPLSSRGWALPEKTIWSFPLLSRGSMNFRSVKMKLERL